MKVYQKQIFSFLVIFQFIIILNIVGTKSDEIVDDNLEAKSDETNSDEAQDAYLVVKNKIRTLQALKNYITMRISRLRAEIEFKNEDIPSVKDEFMSIRSKIRALNALKNNIIMKITKLQSDIEGQEKDELTDKLNVVHSNLNEISEVHIPKLQELRAQLEDGNESANVLNDGNESAKAVDEDKVANAKTTDEALLEESASTNVLDDEIAGLNALNALIDESESTKALDDLLGKSASRKALYESDSGKTSDGIYFFNSGKTSDVEKSESEKALNDQNDSPREINNETENLKSLEDEILTKDEIDSTNALDELSENSTNDY